MKFVAALLLLVVLAVGCAQYHNHKLPLCVGSNADATDIVRHTHGDGLRPATDHFNDYHNPDDYCMDDGIMRKKW